MSGLCGKSHHSVKGQVKASGIKQHLSKVLSQNKITLGVGMETSAMFKDLKDVLGVIPTIPPFN